MLEQLLLHIERHQLCKTTDKILLAVSGGVDSAVMLDLLHKAGYQIGVAHCNFQLRGKDSVADENLVRSMCEGFKIPFHSTNFETAAYAETNGLSVQLAARELRYEFFDKIRTAFAYDLVATAHHVNDAIETVLLNLTRGTGINGLSGIPVKNDRVIRPLLFASRDQILQYAEAANLKWHEDQSNASDDYQRNFLRHNVIPQLKKMNPNLEQTFEKTLERISGAVDMSTTFLTDFKSAFVREEEGRMLIDSLHVREHAYPHVILWELVKSMGFNFDQCRDVVATTQSGKQFYSSSHCLTVDRKFFMISKRDQGKILDVLIADGQQTSTNGYAALHIIKNSNGSLTTRSEAEAQLDASRIAFPLSWRKWKAGDVFQPLGMTSHKKVSDFLIDLKIPTPEKDKISVLESKGKIVWVVGYRISEEFKITPATTVSLHVKVAKLDAEKIS